MLLEGLEPPTYCLQNNCSTTELKQHAENLNRASTDPAKGDDYRCDVQPFSCGAYRGNLTPVHWIQISCNNTIRCRHMEMHGGVEPQTLCVLQTPTRNPLMYEACILAKGVGYDPTLTSCFTFRMIVYLLLYFKLSPHNHFI